MTEIHTDFLEFRNMITQNSGHVNCLSWLCSSLPIWRVILQILFYKIFITISRISETICLCFNQTHLWHNIMKFGRQLYLALDNYVADICVVQFLCSMPYSQKVVHFRNDQHVSAVSDQAHQPSKLKVYAVRNGARINQVITPRCQKL